jgi:hypothetical protein
MPEASAIRRSPIQRTSGVSESLHPGDDRSELFISSTGERANGGKGFWEGNVRPESNFVSLGGSNEYSLGHQIGGDRAVEVVIEGLARDENLDRNATDARGRPLRVTNVQWQRFAVAVRVIRQVRDVADQCKDKAGDDQTRPDVV